MTAFEIEQANRSIGLSTTALGGIGLNIRRMELSERLAFAQAHASLAVAFLQLHDIRADTTAADLAGLQLAARMAIGDLRRGVDPERVAAALASTVDRQEGDG